MRRLENVPKAEGGDAWRRCVEHFLRQILTYDFGDLGHVTDRTEQFKLTVRKCQDQSGGSVSEQRFFRPASKTRACAIIALPTRDEESRVSTADTTAGSETTGTARSVCRHASARAHSANLASGRLVSRRALLHVLQAASQLHR